MQSENIATAYTFQVNVISPYPFQRGDRLYARIGHLYTSESDVCRRQILTYKDGPRTERIKIFLMVVSP